jgi:hypothetical protein
MKTGCAGNRLCTLKLRLSLVSVPVPPKTTSMPIRRLAVNIEIPFVVLRSNLWTINTLVAAIPFGRQSSAFLMHVSFSYSRDS